MLAVWLYGLPLAEHQFSVFTTNQKRGFKSDDAMLGSSSLSLTAFFVGSNHGWPNTNFSETVFCRAGLGYNRTALCPRGVCKFSLSAKIKYT